MAIAEVKRLAQALSKEYNSPNADLAKCGQYLSQLKVISSTVAENEHESARKQCTARKSLINSVTITSTKHFLALHTSVSIRSL